MADLGYHEGYKYSHDFSNHYVEQQYLPDGLQNVRFWQPAENPHEQKMNDFMNRIKNINPQS